MPDAPTTHFIGNVHGTEPGGPTRALTVTVVDRQVMLITAQEGRPAMLAFDRAGIARLRMLLDEAEAGITGARVYALPASPPSNVHSVWTGQPDSPTDPVVYWRRIATTPGSGHGELWEGYDGATTMRLPWRDVISHYGRALDVSPDAPGLPADI